MKAETQIEENALAYEKLIKEKVSSGEFDLIMLGMGDDGHTASLFPHTHGLHTDGRWVIANYVPQKKTWRMTFTFDCINKGKNICLYVMGSKKEDMLARVLDEPYDPDQFPVQRVGTPDHKAIWVMDEAAVVI
jgi:6-phosphogluconolactonase